MRRWLNKVLVGALVLTASVPALNAADAQINSAWQAWDDLDFAKAEAEFKSALKQDPADARAVSGLTFLYSQLNRNDEAFDLYSQFLLQSPDHAPYAYALWGIPAYAMLAESEEHLQLLPKLAEMDAQNPQSNGLLSAITTSSYGFFLEQEGKLQEAKQVFGKLGVINDWMTIGPFENISQSGFDKVFAPELEFDPNARYVGKFAVPAFWFKPSVGRPDLWFDFQRYFSEDKAFFYANTFVYSDSKQAADVRIGTSGALKLFLNDELLTQEFEERNNDVDTYIVRTELQKGWNRILVKVGHNEIDRSNFLLRITDQKGRPLPGLRVSTDKQTYTPKPGAPKTEIADAAVQFFEDKIAANPDHIENHLLLACVHSRSDRKIKVELALRAAEKLAPRNTYVQEQLINAYTENGKYDRALSIVESLEKQAPDLLSSLVYQIERHYEQQEYDKVRELIDKVELAVPEGSQLPYTFRYTYHIRKREADKARQLVREAYEKFPEDISWMTSMAGVLTEKSGSMDPAIELYEDYLDDHYSLAITNQLAGLYLRKGDVDKWEELTLSLLEADPAQAGIHFRMAGEYIDQERYDDALESMKQATDMCPNSAAYWERVGEIHRARNNDKTALEYFYKALDFSPRNYTLRHTIREMEGKGNIFDLFEQVDLDSVIAAAPGASDFPEDNGMYLMDDRRRVVYDRGASEYIGEIAVKVFNQSGVDEVKEYYVPYYGNTERINIERAFVRKLNGSEVVADVSGNYVVFKQLEPGETVYIRYRVQTFQYGRLAGHFWDSHYFNGGYPVASSRYFLLVPESLKFRYNVQNGDIKPEVKTTDDGLLYAWRTDNEPGLHYEYDMPGLTEVGKVLHLSTIEDWAFFVEWYQDLAMTKTRESYEVREKVKQLLQDRGVSKNDLTARERAALVYDFITENIRYSSVSFRQSGLVPQKARDVLETGIGDCKDVSTLAISMLDELDVDAHYVLINTRDEGRNQAVLPSIAWNHCIAAVELDDELMYMDLTANNYSFGSIPELDIDGFSLLIREGETEPFLMPDEGFVPNSLTTKTNMKVRDDNSISVSLKSAQSGNFSAIMRYAFRDKGEQDRKREFKEMLASSFPSVTLNKLELGDLNDIEPEMEYVCEFEVPSYVTETGSFKFLNVPWSSKLSANEALSYDERKYTYLYWPWADTVSEVMEIHLPEGYAPVELGEDVRLSSPVADYTLSFSFENGVLRGTRRLVNKKLEVSPAEYHQFKEFYNSVVKEDQRQILLQKNPVRRQ